MKIAFARLPTDDVYENVLLALDDYLEIHRNIQNREYAMVDTSNTLCDNSSSFVYFSDHIINKLRSQNNIPQWDEITTVSHDDGT